ncbi:putative nuclease HARBI1 isoform X2 [Pseudomyrmex gracilis]|uniref:putative nuclease HARBI1 isoform X2 n=1 Tax=Pseudomyrmex gracilis TaxID=219809 RepID=UPI000994C94E|nr:putative nuclease HARBI1 isoform X2 [Pseudomyrmex gracilis]
MAVQLLTVSVQELCDMIFSSSSSEESEDDVEVINLLYMQEKKELVPRLLNYVEVILPQYNNAQFKSHFRMQRSTFNYIFELLKNTLTRKKPGCQTISPEKQLLIAIWKMSTPDSYRSICEKFNVGRATALKSVRRVVKALINFAPVFIKWPNEEKAIEISNGFLQTSGFPNIIGVIDGTHINIRAPHLDPKCYVNRKGRYSIHLQCATTNVVLLIVI